MFPVSHQTELYFMGFKRVTAVFVVLVALAAWLRMGRIHNLQQSFKATEKFGRFCRQIYQDLMMTIRRRLRANEYITMGCLRLATPDFMRNKTRRIVCPYEGIHVSGLLFVIYIQENRVA